MATMNYVRRRNVGQSIGEALRQRGEGREGEAGLQRRGGAKALSGVHGCLMDVAVGSCGAHTVSHQSRAENGRQTFTPLKEVALEVFVRGRPRETSKSESNHASCDHGVTGVPRVTLVP
jgi:hypothetical protein